MAYVGITGEILSNPIVLGELSTDPVTVPDTGFVYTKDVAGVTQLFYKDSAGLVTQITPPPVGGVTLNGAYNFGGPGAGRTITAISGSVDINSTGNAGLKIVQTDGTVSTEGAIDVTKNQTVDLNQTTRGQNYTTILSAAGLAGARNLQGFFNTVTFSGDMVAPNKCSIIGQVNTVSITGITAGRVGSGDAAGLYGGMYTFKTTYAPPVGSLAQLSSVTNISSEYLHNGDSTGATSGIIGVNQSLVFGGGTKYTITNVHGFLASATFGVGAVGSTVTNLYGMRISAAVIGAGVTVTNNYGLRIENITGGANNWALYVAGGLSYFGGNVDSSNAGSIWWRPPRMTTAQRNAMIVGWVLTDAGKMWYNTTTNQWEGWNGAGVAIIG